MAASRYSVQASVETTFQPGSSGRVLLNLQGIPSVRQMDQLEYDNLLIATNHYLENVLTESTVFTAQIIREFHFHWLGSIYEWAGKYRSVNLSKSGFQWPPYGRVPVNMENFEQQTLRHHTPARNQSIDSLALSMAIVHGEFLLIHPFRDGNGRVGRWIVDMMAMQAGYPHPSYPFLRRPKKKFFEEYVAAVMQAYARDYRALTGFFTSALEVALAERR